MMKAVIPSNPKPQANVWGFIFVTAPLKPNLQSSIANTAISIQCPYTQVERPTMITIFDVAAYLIEKHGPISVVKLHKLAYYTQAWSLVFDDRLLFNEPIEAWANGPLIPRLFNAHQDMYVLDESFCKHGDSTKLDATAITTIDKVLQAYGDMDTDDLIALTHRERPWREAHNRTPDVMAGHVFIDTDVMQEYYSAVLAADHANSSTVL